mmetsp:Transcript_1033/g.1930  ORF Transcript_1033/g.1930 Transcript_1033/m.1930 type:complete len:224 (+) Transcript_1033:247-918(+)
MSLHSWVTLPRIRVNLPLNKNCKVLRSMSCCTTVLPTSVRVTIRMPTRKMKLVCTRSSAPHNISGKEEPLSQNSIEVGIMPRTCGLSNNSFAKSKRSNPPRLEVNRRKFFLSAKDIWHPMRLMPACWIQSVSLNKSMGKRRVGRLLPRISISFTNSGDNKNVIAVDTNWKEWMRKCKGFFLFKNTWILRMLFRRLVKRRDSNFRVKHVKKVATTLQVVIADII